MSSRRWAGMVTTEAHAPGGTTFIQRWLARLAFVAIAAAVLVPPVAAGVRLSLALLVVAVACLIVTAAAVWWALAYRGLQGILGHGAVWPVGPTLSARVKDRRPHITDRVPDVAV